ncbi:GNAT family N-acetyltransferase [Pleomorphomonas sp. JP5]|uniref:GNAT family N-acetyltransferase n=1 Tax=Pleomorphomonas sp. JP5 TaxID=2942998 RepID=UPI002043053F|nr:GNAT family N-acetyltransferase [Pleomorphomonas sp. JP5]MCM5558631.1 GNAT family N-acetyltransferase [Pleomorphomonas sp. JP5]
MIVRPASPADSKGMSAILGEILASWNSDRPSSADHVRAFYIEHPDRIECSVAVSDEGEIVGFQALKLAREGNSWNVPPGWGVIGTYVKLGVGRRGVGRALFAATQQAARAASLPTIDATIAETNALGLAYYEAMGFRTYRQQPGMISKVYMVTP